jgi:hypothetical protein
MASLDIRPAAFAEHVMADQVGLLMIPVEDLCMFVQETSAEKT